MSKRKRAGRSERPAQTATFMLRIYGREGEYIRAIKEYLNDTGLFLTPVTSSGAVRWALHLANQTVHNELKGDIQCPKPTDPAPLSLP